MTSKINSPSIAWGVLLAGGSACMLGTRECTRDVMGLSSTGSRDLST